MKITQAEFEEYEEEFNNAVDKGALFDRYYDPNAAFVRPYKGTFRGKDELVRFWNAEKNSGHDGIHEILHSKNFISDEGKMAVELDIEWRCFKDTNYFGPRKKGDVFWGRAPPSTRSAVTGSAMCSSTLTSWGTDAKLPDFAPL